MNTIFRKWLFAYLSITFIGILLLTASISIAVQREFYRQGLDQLRERATEIELSYRQYRAGDMSLADFKQTLKETEKTGALNVSIVGKRVTFLRKELLQVGVRPDVLSWIDAVGEGNRIEKIRKFRQSDNQKMLIVGFPLGTNGKIEAAAFVYTPVANADRLAKPIRRTIWFISLLSAVPLILFLWGATRKLTQPIRQMSDAAERIADGDFSSRVTIEGEDELAKLGTSFNRMAERIERIEEQRRRLITEITHELRTPLTSIRTGMQALSDGILTDAEEKQVVELSLAESARLGKLIDNLQELSAFEEHQIRFHFAKMNLTQLAKAAVEQFRHQADQSGCRVVFDDAAQNPVYVQADAERLRQVLINLIGNALNHNDPGTTVTVRIRGHQGKATLVVQDDGRGIPEEHLPRLFDRFYKAEPSRSSRGTGVGLTISRHIVHAHGGTIKAESKWGKGTEIRIELPLARG